MLRECPHVCSLEPFRDKDTGKLGLLQFPKTTRGNVPFPVELHIPGVRVVSLAAGKESVRIPSLLLHISFTCIPTVLSTHSMLMVVCMSGVGSFELFCFVLKSLGTDNEL